MNGADTAWIIVATALVLFMTLPGLALFYGGLVRTKNVLSVVAWCFGITSLVTVLWWSFGYSLVFGRSFGSPFLGGTEFLFLRGVGAAPNPDYSFWVSHNVFATYQLAFAIITPAVITMTVRVEYQQRPLSNQGPHRCKQGKNLRVICGSSIQQQGAVIP